MAEKPEHEKLVNKYVGGSIAEIIGIFFYMLAVLSFIGGIVAIALSVGLPRADFVPFLAGTVGAVMFLGMGAALRSLASIDRHQRLNNELLIMLLKGRGK